MHIKIKIKIFIVIISFIIKDLEIKKGTEKNTVKTVCSNKLIVSSVALTFNLK